MKTLVIHPNDITTGFLESIYYNRNWTVLNGTESKSVLKRAIFDHDRLVFLGHGTERGLIGPNYRSLIDSSFVYLLREKIGMYIWCNADVFFKKYALYGFYTGMIISDDMEANLYSVNATQQDINESNMLFAQSIKEAIDNNDSDTFNILDDVLLKYNSNNPIVSFNKKNIYHYSN